jgi:hypothetical protein
VRAVGGEETGAGGAKDGDRVPRGALAVVAVGLVATVAAALLANENLSGPAAGLEWVQETPIPDSASVPVPGGSGEVMRLSQGHLRATGVNFSEYSLFGAGIVLRIDAGAPVGRARLECAQRAHGGAEAAQTPHLRASYPRSSETNLAEQQIPESGVQVEFSSHGTYLAEVQLEDLPSLAANEPGIKLEWPTYHVGVERWHWYLPPGAPQTELALPFATVWRTSKVPAVSISCSLTTSAGTATVRTAAALPRISEPIAE